MKSRNRKGQGILESMIAIYIAIIGLMSVMGMVFYNIQSQSLSHNILIASNLAREGIEQVRNIRDSNWLNDGKEWDDKLTFISNPAHITLEHNDGNSFLIWNGLYRNSIDFNTYSYGASWEKCTKFDETLDTVPCRLYILPNINNQDFLTYGLFGETVRGSMETKFYRLIYINEICLDEDDQEYILDSFDDHCSDSGAEKIGLQILSKVGWDDKNSIKSVLVEERMYNWK